MSISFSPTPSALRVEIKPSTYFCIALAGIAAIAIAAIFYAQLSWPLRCISIGFVCIYAGYCWHRQLRQRGVLHWRSAWIWVDAANAEHALRLRRVTVWPGLIVLQFDGIERGYRTAFTLLPDSFAAASEARRLRMYLLHFPVFAAGIAPGSAD